MNANIVIFENQYQEYISVYKYLEKLVHYSTYPKPKDSSEKTKYTVFSDCFRVWANPNYGRTRQDEALQHIVRFLSEIKPSNVIMDYLLITGHNGKNGIDLVKALIDVDGNNDTWSIMSSKIIFISKTDESEVHNELKELNDQLPNHNKAIWINKSLAELSTNDDNNDRTEHLISYYDRHLKSELSSAGAEYLLAVDEIIQTPRTTEIRGKESERQRELLDKLFRSDNPSQHLLNLSDYEFNLVCKGLYHLKVAFNTNRNDGSAFDNTLGIIKSEYNKRRGSSSS